MSESQTPYIPGGFLNSPGTSVFGQDVANALGTSWRQGGLGKWVRYDGGGENTPPYTTSTLYGGIYQPIQLKSGVSVAGARGLIAFWYDYENYIVTTDDTAGLEPAGVFLSAVPAAYYGWVQVQGKATLKFQSSTTKVTPAAGDIGIYTSGLSATADVLADATAVTWATKRLQVGRLLGSITTQLALVTLLTQLHD